MSPTPTMATVDQGNFMGRKKEQDGPVNAGLYHTHGADESGGPAVA